MCGLCCCYADHRTGAHSASAQSNSTPPSSPSEQLWLSGGIGQDGRFDATASSLHFDGRGANIALGFDRGFGGWSLLTWIGADSRALTPLAATLSSGERLTEGALDIALLRPWGTPASSMRGLSLGIDLSANYVLTTPKAQPTRLLHFMLAMATLGPTALWRQSLGTRSIIMQALHPLSSRIGGSPVF